MSQVYHTWRRHGIVNLRAGDKKLFTAFSTSCFWQSLNALFPRIHLSKIQLPKSSF